MEISKIIVLLWLPITCERLNSLIKNFLNLKNTITTFSLKSFKYSSFGGWWVERFKQKYARETVYFRNLLQKKSKIKRKKTYLVILKSNKKKKNVGNKNSLYQNDRLRWAWRFLIFHLMNYSLNSRRIRSWTAS